MYKNDYKKDYNFFSKNIKILNNLLSIINLKIILFLNDINMFIYIKRKIKLSYITNYYIKDYFKII